jgi:RNA polymerase sigma-70 factor (ECF subfamily)
MLAVGVGRVSPWSSDPAAQQSIVDAAARGDREAAEQLVRGLLPRVRNLVRYFVRGDSEVDDLAQESLVTILRGLSSYRGEGSVVAWSDRIVVRTVFAYLRKARASHKLHVEYTADLVPVPAGESAHGFLARRQAIRALDELPDEQRDVLVMHHVLGLSVREIAEEVDAAFETVRSRLRLGMARLRNAVDPEQEPAVRSK